MDRLNSIAAAIEMIQKLALLLILALQLAASQANATPMRLIGSLIAYVWAYFSRTHYVL
jgi:hypothetical protein